MRRELLDRVQAAKRAGTPAALVTDLESGLQSIVHPEVIEGSLGLEPAQLAAVRAMVEADRSGIIEERLFVQVLNPPPRLVIVGAVHIAQALAPMAALAGYGVIIIDPRRAFATDDRFPSIRLVGDWPDEALEQLKPDARTAVVTLTHDPKLDDPALETALRSPAFYIGALGSRKTHAARLSRLVERGFTEAELARIHGPVGLDIGAVTQSEIALAILAQMTEARRRGAPGRAKQAA